MKRLYIELPPDKQDGPAMTFSEQVDGLNENALEMVSIKVLQEAIRQRDTYIKAYNPKSSEVLIEECNKILEKKSYD